MRLCLAAAFLVLTTSLASAQAPGQTMSWQPDPAPPSATAPQTITVSYRSHVLVADGLSLAAVIAGNSSDNPGLAAWGVTGYFLAAPIVHLAHGRGIAALESFGLRAGLPFAGAYLGYHLGPRDTGCVADAAADSYPPSGSSCNDGSIIGLLLGGVAGGVGAMVLDAKYLAKYDKRVAAPTWSASINPAHGGVSVGVSGSF
jgi:hypothetical protein